MEQIMVEDHHRGHCLDNGNGARNNTGVVAPFSHKGHRLSMLIDGGLRFQKCCNGLKCHPKEDVLPIADAALNAPAVIG